MPVGDLRRWQNRVYRNGGGQWAGTGTCGKRDPLVTTSRGTGELILQALESGATNIIIGIGSATNDGGAGMVQALGRNYAMPTAMKLVLAAVVLIL